MKIKGLSLIFPEWYLKMLQFLWKTYTLQLQAPKKKRKSTVLQRRKLKTFNNLLDDEKHRLATDPDDHQVSYFTVAAPPSLYPPRRFCEVCGNFSKYVCIVCGAFYCQVKCLNTHKVWIFLYLIVSIYFFFEVVQFLIHTHSLNLRKICNRLSY